jgi:uncharacterized protein YdiU (UPF0061 family)
MASLERFGPAYAEAWTTGMRAKLGLSGATPDEVLAPLVGDLLAMLQQQPRGPHVVLPPPERRRPWRRRADPRGVPRPARDRTPAGAVAGVGPDRDAMDRVNPVYVPLQPPGGGGADAATGGDLAPFTRLLDVLAAPYDERPGLERYAAPGPRGRRLPHVLRHLRRYAGMLQA